MVLGLKTGGIRVFKGLRTHRERLKRLLRRSRFSQRSFSSACESPRPTQRLKRTLRLKHSTAPLNMPPRGRHDNWPYLFH